MPSKTKTTNDNIKKAQKVWKEMSPRQRALAQPQGRGRKKPGMGGEGDWYRIEVRPKNEFTTFRYHDVGEKGEKSDVMRLAGKRSSGSWDTQAWLINKKSAHVANGTLVADTQDAKNLLKTLGSTPKHLKGDIFTAKDRPNIPESKKPTEAQKNARMRNIKKAQAARRK